MKACALTYKVVNDLPNQMKYFKSTLQDLKDLFKNNITAKHISEQLYSCEANDDAVIVREQLKDDLDFDVIGIKEGGKVCGYVERSSLLVGPCRNYRKVFDPSELVDQSTPLMEVLLALHDIPRIFVLDENREVSGIVTRGDLQKAPVRLWLFGLATILEMHLLRLIRHYYADDSWQDILSKKRLKEARDRLIERQQRNEAIDLADCLQLCDKRKLILKIPNIIEQIKREYGESGPKMVKNRLELAEELRDKVAHAQDIVTGSTWPEVIDLVKSIEQLIEFFERIKS